MTRVKHKEQMYEMLTAGVFGNTTRQWFTDWEWFKDCCPDAPLELIGEWLAGKHGLYAIRNARVSGDRTRSQLNLTPRETALKWTEWYPDGGGQISPMVDHMLTARFHVVETLEAGLCVWIIEGHADIPWRAAWNDPTIAREIYGPHGRVLLKHYLNDNSYDDLLGLLDLYPQHVVELTALDRCFGTIPGRNAIVWEVRDY